MLVKDVAKVDVGYVPRLGIAGQDKDDDIVFGIVVMGRTYQTDQVLPAVEAEIDRMNHDGSLPAGVKVVPFYDRGIADRGHHPHRSAQSDFRMPADFSDPMDFPRRSAERDYRRVEHSRSRWFLPSFCW